MFRTRHFPKATAILAGALAIIALAAASPEAQEADRTPVLTAAGQGSVSVVPDIAIVTMGVVSRAGTANAALSSNSADLANVIDAVRDEGVEDTDIGTTGFSIRPIHERLRPDQIGENPPAIVGYQVSNQIRVVIRDIAGSGGLLDRVVRAGANQVNGISFDIDDRQAAADAALASAIADARRKAEIMADAAGVRLVRILSVSSGDDRRGPVFERALAVRADAVPVMPGEQAVTASATVIWEIAPR